MSSLVFKIIIFFLFNNGLDEIFMMDQIEEIDIGIDDVVVQAEEEDFIDVENFFESKDSSPQNDTVIINVQIPSNDGSNDDEDLPAKIFRKNKNKKKEKEYEWYYEIEWHE